MARELNTQAPIYQLCGTIAMEFHVRRPRITASDRAMTGTSDRYAERLMSRSLSEPSEPNICCEQCRNALARVNTDHLVLQLVVSRLESADGQALDSQAWGTT